MYASNSRAVSIAAEYLLRHNPCSRIQMAQDTGLTASIVTHTVKLMMDAGFVQDTGVTISKKKGSGRAQKLLSLNPDYTRFLGIEINIGGIHVLIMDCVGNVLAQVHAGADEFSPENINETTVQLAESCIQQAGGLPAAAGLAVPGHVDQHDQFISNKPQYQYLNIQKIREKLHMPLYAENNIEVMALNEYIRNPESTPDQFLFLHIGPGMYCSQFNSSIENERDFFVGEIGHTVIDPNGPLCECGKTGCLQTYISDSWLIKKARMILENSHDTVLHSLVDSPDQITIDTIRKAYALQDPLIYRDLDNGIHKLALSLGNVLIMSNAKKLYINSALLQDPELTKRLIQEIQTQLDFIKNRRQVQIEILPFNPWRGALGAAALAEYAFLVKDSGEFYRRLLEQAGMKAL